MICINKPILIKPFKDITKNHYYNLNTFIITLLFFLIKEVVLFDFKEVITTVTDPTINILTTYSFLYDRTSSNFGLPPPYQTQPVNSTDTIKIIFPSDYVLSGSQNCVSVSVNSQSVTGFNTSVVSNTITIFKAFATITNFTVTQVIISIVNVLNPSPAITTGQFVGYVGNDRAAPNGYGVQLKSATFTDCKIIFNPTTVNSVSTMVFQITPKNSIPSTGSIQVTLPVSRVWTNDITSTALPVATSMTCSNYSTNVNTAIICTGNLTSFKISASNLFTGIVASSFSFGVNNFKSPPTTQSSDFITVTSKSGIYSIDSCISSISSLTAKSLLSFLITPLSSFVVNQQVGVTISLTLADIIDQNDTFQITFPTQLGFTIASAASGTGLFNTPTRSGQVLTITQRTTARQYNASSIFLIYFYNLIAPPSIKVTNTITIKIKRNGFQKNIGTTAVQAIASTLTSTIVPTVTTVSATTSYSINVTIIDSLSSSGIIKIYFPVQITISNIASNCAILLGTGVYNAPICSTSVAQRSLTISSLNSSSSNIPVQTLQFTISGIVNAPSSATTGGFSVQSYYTSSTDTLVARGTMAGITPTPGTILSSKVIVVPSSYICLQSSTTYTITFETPYQIPVNGYIQLLVPRLVSMTIGSVGTNCQYTLNAGTFTSTSCIGDNSSSTYYKVTFNGIAQTAIPAYSNVSLKITNIFTNPPTTAIVSSFGLTTYALGGAKIASLLTGITVQMTTPASFVTTSVSRASNINSGIAEYTVTLSQKAALQASAILQVTFPSEVQLGISPLCTDLSSNSLSCTASSNQLIVTLTSAKNSLDQFGVKVAGVTNPPSFQPIANSFIFSTFTADSLSKYAQSTKLFNLSNSLSSLFTSISGQFSPRTYGSIVSLTIKITPSARIVPTKIVVSAPPSFTINGYLACSAFVGFSGSCDDNRTSTHTIQIGGVLTASQMIFTIIGLVAPNSAPSDYTTVTSFDSSGFKIDESNTDIIFSIICTLPCKTCTSGVPTQCLSCYNVTISSNIYLYQTNHTCLTSCPTGTFADSSIFKCVICDSICLQCSIASNNCTKCNTSTVYQYLNISGTQGTCLSACPTGYYPDSTQSPVLCVLCQNPCVTCTSKTTCLSCNGTTFFNGTQCVLNCPIGTYIQNTIARRCDPCNTVCSTCSITTDNCTTCASTAAYYNNTCLSVCPAPLVVNNGVCASCDTSCLTCSINYKNCTSCNINSANYKYLLNNTCINPCPSLYYPDNLAAQCKLCSTLTNLHCNNCSTSTTCLSCNTPYVLLGTSCIDTVPPGYVNISGIAQPCTGDCATCSVFQYNCTACKTLNLQGNDCIPTCPTGKVAQNKICVLCTSPCLTCSNIKTNCTSCISNNTPQYYLNNNNCDTICPDFTYGDNLTNKCQACIQPCQKCISSSECRSCLGSTGKFLEGTQCVLTCSPGFLGVNRVCNPCLLNCSLCVNTTSTCTKCVANHYLVTSTSTCVAICPTGLYPNLITGSCTGCTYPCNTCVNTSSTCLTCLSNFFFNYTCVPTCPDKYYQLNSICQSCPTECQTCLSTSHCTSCVYTYYLYLNIFCVSQCPKTYPVIAANGSCTICSDTQCTQCNASDYCLACNFPKLLFIGSCIDSCPTDYTSNTTHCNYNPTVTPNTTTNQTLTQSLTTVSMFPVPFTIAAAFIAIACLMSRFQYASTYIPGSLLSLISLLQWGAIVFAAVITSFKYLQVIYVSQHVKDIYPYYILIASIGAHYLLNILALLFQNCILMEDTNFKKWKNLGPTKAFYVMQIVVSLLTTHKFANIMFSKLFNFTIFKARLDGVQQFKVFNAFSFLGLGPAAGTLVAVILLIFWDPETNTQLFMAYIDVIILVTVCIILAIFNTCKGQQYFEQRTSDGHIFHKRIQESDEIMKQAIMPQTHFNQEYHGYGKLQSGTQLRLRLTKNPYSQSDSQSISEDLMKNISIQVNEIIEKQFDESKIDHMQHQSSVPQIQFFSKHQKSAQYSIKSQNQVSIQNVPFYNQISIQKVPSYNQVSIQQNALSQHDFSLQNVPNYNQQGAQVSHDVKNISIQYSAKPIFQNVSQDFISDITHSDEQQSNINNQSTRPVKKQVRLRAEMELDIDQKLKRRQQQLKNLQQQNRRLERQSKAKIFQKKQSQLQQNSKKKQQTPIQNGLNRERINSYFNNNESIQEQSSELDSKGDIMAHLKSQSKNKYNRIQSQKSQQQFIELLEKGKKSKDKDMYIDLGDHKNQQRQINNSLSFNVTRDLDPINHSSVYKQQQQVVFEKNKKAKVIYQQQDKSRNSDEDYIQQPQLQIQRNQNQNIMQGDLTQILPQNIQKSRSTNNISLSKHMMSRNRNNNLLIDNDNQMDDSQRNQEYQEIINNPIDPRYQKGNLPQSRYHQQQLDFDTRTNLTKFLQRKSKNPLSAQINSKHSSYQFQNDFNLQSKQMPLQIKSKQKERSVYNLRNQESQQQSFSVNPKSAHVGRYRMDSKRLLLESKNLKDLQFNQDDRIDVNPTEEIAGNGTLKQQQQFNHRQRSRFNREENDAISRQLAKGNQNIIQQQHQIQRQLRPAKSQKKFKSHQKPVHRQLLNSKSKKDFNEVSRVTKYLQKQQKKAQNNKRRLQQIQYMLQRQAPVRVDNQNKGYMRDTYASQQKRKSLQKVYLNKLKKY